MFLLQMGQNEMDIFCEYSHHLNTYRFYLPFILYNLDLNIYFLQSFANGLGKKMGIAAISSEFERKYLLTWQGSPP